MMSDSSVRSLIFAMARALSGSRNRLKIGVRHHHVLRLPSNPAAHIDVAVSRSRPRRVDVQTDARVALFAVAAAPTGDGERHRDQDTDPDELHLTPRLSHFPRNLVAQNQSLGSGRAAAHHVLVAAANIGAYDFENNPVLALARDYPHPGEV